MTSRHAKALDTGMSNRYTLDGRSLARLLSPVLYLSEATIRRNISRYPESLPPATYIRGKKKIWHLDPVVDFFPSDIGAAIRMSVAREFEEALPRVIPPAMRPLAEDLASAAQKGRNKK